MFCKNKEILIKGLRANYEGIPENEMPPVETIQLRCIVTNDKIGKTLSICDGERQFILPFEPLQKDLR